MKRYDPMGMSDSGLRFVTERVKPLSEIRPVDVPPGLDPEDVATDFYADADYEPDEYEDSDADED